MKEQPCKDGIKFKLNSGIDVADVNEVGMRGGGDSLRERWNVFRSFNFNLIPVPLHIEMTNFYIRLLLSRFYLISDSLQKLL